MYINIPHTLTTDVWFDLPSVFNFYLTVAARQSVNTVIAHPGQDVELSCNVTSGTAVWLINNDGPYSSMQLFNGQAPGHNSTGNNLIVMDITMNDSRNGSEYQCIVENVLVNGMVLHITGMYIQYRTFHVCMYVCTLLQVLYRLIKCTHGYD